MTFPAKGDQAVVGIVASVAKGLEPTAAYTPEEQRTERKVTGT
jgi:hypothetical protein